MSISQTTIKQLFSLSAGRCNLCNSQLVTNNIQIAEMAHIIAKKSNGARGSISQEHDNSYNNLILLCPNCHTKVDKYPEDYSIEKLITLKNEHENSIKSKLNIINKDYLKDLSSLNTLFQVIPITTFRDMVWDLPYKISTNFDATDMFEEFCMRNPQSYPFWDKKLTKLWESFLYQMRKIEDWMLGSLTIKTNKFITMSEMMDNIHQNELCYNIYDSSGYDNYLILNNKKLNHEQLDLIHNEIPILVQEFIYAHTELIDYIRFEYRDIQW